MTPSARIATWLSGHRYAPSRNSEAAWPVAPEHKQLRSPQKIVRALRVLRGYRPAAAVLGRSSIRTWLNSVLSLCAPHWGQRSADDHALHRGHALCLRFGTTSLSVHRCRIFDFLEHPNEVAPQQVDQCLPPNLAPTGAAETSSTNSIRIGSPEGTPLPRVSGHEYQPRQQGAIFRRYGEALVTEIIVQIPAVRLHVAQSRDAHEHRLALGGGPWCHAPTAESPRPSCDRLAGDLGAMDRRLSFRPTGQRARRGRKRNRQ